MRVVSIIIPVYRYNFKRELREILTLAARASLVVTDAGTLDVGLGVNVAKEKGAMDEYFENAAKDSFLAGIETKESFSLELFRKAAENGLCAKFHSAKTNAEFGVLFQKDSVKNGKCHVRLHAIMGVLMEKYAQHKLTLTCGARGQTVIKQGWV